MTFVYRESDWKLGSVRGGNLGPTAAESLAADCMSMVYPTFTPPDYGERPSRPGSLSPDGQ